MENRQDELQPKKWDFETWCLFQDPENLIHMFPEMAATRAEGWSSLSHERMIKLEIMGAQWDEKAKEGAELESTLSWLLCATKLITGFRSFLVMFQPVKHAQLLSLFICFAVWDVRVVLWHYLKLLSRDRQKHLDRDSKLFLELKRRFQARSQLSCPG